MRGKAKKYRCFITKENSKNFPNLSNFVEELCSKNVHQYIGDLIKKDLNLSKDQVWVYISELEPSQMIEYGEILPKSGQEKKWFNQLPKKLKNKLLKLDF